MVLQSEIVCERCWCDMKCDMVMNDGATWNVVWFGLNQCQKWSVFDTVECGEVRDAMAMCYTLHISPQQLNNISHQTTFPAQHTIPHLSTQYHISYHSTSHHISRISIPPDHTA